MSGTAQLSGSTDWGFDVVGTYGDSDIGGGSDTILINFAYLDEARLVGKGTVQHFNVAVSDPKLSVTVADEIDRRFTNSRNETRTESLQEMAQSQMQARDGAWSPRGGSHTLHHTCELSSAQHSRRNARCSRIGAKKGRVPVVAVDTGFQGRSDEPSDNSALSRRPGFWISPGTVCIDPRPNRAE
jgi:hypothetical protein